MAIPALRPGVSVLIKPASGMCNMHCDYCFYCDEMQKRLQESYGFMSADTLRNVIRRTLMRAGRQYTIAFQGGEPTLCGLDFFRRMVSYLERFNKNHTQVNIALQTNGYGMNEEWARFLAENHVLVGLSVDGTEEIHTAYRHANNGGNTYEHVLHAAKLLDDYHVDYNILTVVHRRIAENIRSIYQDYKRRGWNYLQFIACLDPLGEKRGEREYSLTAEIYGRFLCELFDLWYEDWKRGEQPYIRQFENYIGIMLGVEPESCEQLGHCGTQYVVEADGGVYPCDFYVLDEFRLGNFNENLLPEIDEKRLEVNYVARSLTVPEKCRSCPWYALCRNGCFRCRETAPVMTCIEKDPASQNHFCEGYRMFFEHCGDRMWGIAEAVRRSR